MKQFILIAFLLLAASCLRAQETILGKTEKDVLEYNNSTSVQAVFVRKTQLSDSNKMLTFHPKDDTYVELMYIFNADDVCIMYTISEPKVRLIDVLRELNSKYNKIDDNKWVTINNEIVIELTIMNNIDEFDLTFEKI